MQGCSNQIWLSGPLLCWCNSPPSVMLLRWARFPQPFPLRHFYKVAEWKDAAGCFLMKMWHSSEPLPTRKFHLVFIMPLFKTFTWFLTVYSLTSKLFCTIYMAVLDTMPGYSNAIVLILSLKTNVLYWASSLSHTWSVSHLPLLMLCFCR